ncbi:hypothetical protein ACWEOW_16975 [Monashia sp. NPDC004114]
MTSTLSPHPGRVAPRPRAIAPALTDVTSRTGPDLTDPILTGRGSTLSSVGAAGAADRGRILAFAAPMALFAYGILRWVDGLDSRSGSGPLAVAAGAMLVVAVAGLAWLTAALASRAEHLPVAVPAGLLAAFGAGATGAVWLGHTVGLFDDAIPSALAAGGPVLVGIALAAVLGALTIEARMPVSSLALAGAAAAVLMLPFDLLPLGALLLLIALAPLGRQTNPGSM